MYRGKHGGGHGGKYGVLTETQRQVKRSLK